MIFGYNTDVKLGEVVYHVQSEARAAEMVLQTMVFVQGRCIGKRTVSYSETTAQPGYNEQLIQEMLKAQHRWVVEAARDGYVEDALSIRR